MFWHRPGGLDRLLQGLLLSIALLATSLAAPAASFSQSPHAPAAGSKEEALRNLADEEAELQYLYEGHEVSPEDYRLTKARHWVLRQYLLGLPARLIDLPEVYIMTKSELGSFFQHPPEVGRLSRGALYEDHLRYKGKVSHILTFYVFERE